jgi:hypothetical protein
MYILKVVGYKEIQNSHLRDEYIRFSGGYDTGDLGKFQRQTKYKLQAAMEMNLLTDFRSNALENEF